jgi:predicted metal-dependent HD superfamily phosphohydrolase
MLLAVLLAVLLAALEYMEQVRNCRLNRERILWDSGKNKVLKYFLLEKHLFAAFLIETLLL